MKRILIVNAWGDNKGDEAMINSLIKLLNDNFKDIKIDIAQYRKDSLNLKNVNIINRIGKYYYSPFSNILAKIQGPIKYSINNKKSNYLFVNFTLKFLSRFTSSFVKNYDLIISAPQGPTIGDLYNLQDKILLPLKYAKKYNIPYIICGISAGPFNNKQSKETYEILNSAKFIIVREDISYNYLKNAFNLSNVYSALDIAFTIPIKKTKEFDKIKNLFKNKPIGSCISLTPQENSTFDKEKYLEKINSFYEYVIQKTGKNLILYPHLSFDMPFLIELKEKNKFKDKIFILPENLNSDIQQYSMKYLSNYISSRYHPTIFAIKNDIPCMVIENQFKVRGMLEKINLNLPICKQDDSLDKLKETFDKLISNQNKIRLKIKTKKPLIKKINNAYYKLFKRIKL